MTKRIIFLDIDGTFAVAGTNMPPESAIRAVQEARSKGHLVFLCTGRNYDMLRPLLSYGFDGVVASAGGYICYNNQVIYDCPMTREQQKFVLDTLQQNGIFRTVECLDGTYADDGFEEFLGEYAGKGDYSELFRWKKQLEEELNIRSMREYSGQPVYKVMFMSPDSSRIKQAAKELEKDFFFCIQDANKYGIVDGEVINWQFNKGKALIRVCEYLHIPVKDSIAFGDSMNDKEMMEAAGYSVCMENGSDTLKQLADAVCPRVEQDGLYHGFLKLGLI